MSWHRARWLRAMDARVPAVHAHEVAAALYERMGDATHAGIESQRAVLERAAYADAAAQHPEWSSDLSFGVLGGDGTGGDASSDD